MSIQGSYKPRKPKLGLICMDKKAKSEPMKALLSKLNHDDYLDIVEFPECMLLNEDIDKWPAVDVIIGFHSKGFPLRKAIAYERLHRRALTINSLSDQRVLLSRFDVYRRMDQHSIPTCMHILLEREPPAPERICDACKAIMLKTGNSETRADSICCTCEYKDPPGFIDEGEYIEYEGTRIYRPFLEKPQDSEDHNIWIYYPSVKGPLTEAGEKPKSARQEGVTKLFRKVDNRSSVFVEGYFPIRRNGSYVYEAFLQPEGNTDVKIYAIFPNYILAEKRKAPHIDGVVLRDPETRKEVREPTELTSKERDISNLIWRAFKQRVCGYDFIRSGNKSYVCDVNGWSFVKTNSHYYDNCARILRELIHQALNIDQRALTVTYGLQLEEYCFRKYEHDTTTTNVGEYTYKSSNKYFIDHGYLKVLANKKSSLSQKISTFLMSKDVFSSSSSSGPSSTDSCAPKSSELPASESKAHVSFGDYVGCTMKPRGLVSILRHGDRIPKFKLKITSSNNSLFKIFAGILDRDVELKEYNRREEELRDFVLRPEYSVGRAEEIATTISSILTEIGYDLMELETAPLLTESIDTSYDSPSSSSAECDEGPEKGDCCSVREKVRKHLTMVRDGISIKLSSLKILKSLPQHRQSEPSPISETNTEASSATQFTDAIFFSTQEIEALKLAYALLRNEIAGTKIQLRVVKKAPLMFQMIIKWGGYLSIAGLRQSFLMGKQIRRMFLTYFDDPATYFRDKDALTTSLRREGTTPSQPPTNVSSPLIAPRATPLQDEDIGSEAQTAIREKRCRLFSQILHVFYGNERRVRKTAIGVLLGICADIDAEIDDIFPCLSNYDSYELAPNALKLLNKLYGNDQPLPYIHLYPSQLSQILVEGGDILASKSRLVTAAMRAEQHKINEILNRTVSSVDKFFSKTPGSAMQSTKISNDCAHSAILSLDKLANKHAFNVDHNTETELCPVPDFTTSNLNGTLACESTPNISAFQNDAHLPHQARRLLMNVVDSSRTLDYSDFLCARTGREASGRSVKKSIMNMFSSAFSTTPTGTTAAESLSLTSHFKRPSSKLTTVCSQPGLELLCPDQKELTACTELEVSTSSDLLSARTDLSTMYSHRSISPSSRHELVPHCALAEPAAEMTDSSVTNHAALRSQPTHGLCPRDVAADYAYTRPQGALISLSRECSEPDSIRILEAPLPVDSRRHVPDKYVSTVMQAFRGCLRPTTFALHRDAAYSIYTSMKTFIKEAQRFLATDGATSNTSFNLSKIYRDFGDEIYLKSSRPLNCEKLCTNTSAPDNSVVATQGFVENQDHLDPKHTQICPSKLPIRIQSSKIPILSQLKFVLKSMKKDGYYDFSKLVDIYQCLRFVSIHYDKLAYMDSFNKLYKHVELYAQNLAYYNYGVQELDRGRIAYSIGGMLLDAVLGDLVQYTLRLTKKQSAQHRRTLLTESSTGGIAESSLDCKAQHAVTSLSSTAQICASAGDQHGTPKDEEGLSEQSMLAEIYVGGEAYLHATINLLLSQDHLLPFLAKERCITRNISYLANVHFVLWELSKPGLDPTYLMETFFSPGTTSDIFQPNTHNTQPIDQPETLIHPIPLQFLNGLVSKSIRQAQQKKTSERLLSTVCVLRHADRTPKQRLKFRVQDEHLVVSIMAELSSSPIAPADVTLWSANHTDKKLIDAISKIIDGYIVRLGSLCYESGAGPTSSSKSDQNLLANLNDLLTIIRNNPPALKIQVKFPTPWKGVKVLTLIAKYGGLLTKMGTIQSRQCGQQIFRTLVDDVLDNEESNQTTEQRLNYLHFLIRTCRVYCNDEPRVRETAEECVSRIVECWNSHLAGDNKDGIIHWDKTSVTELTMLSEVDKYARSLIDDQKRTLNEALTSSVNLSNANPSTLSPTLRMLLRNIPPTTQVELQIPSLRLGTLKDLLFKLISDYEEFFLNSNANNKSCGGTPDEVDNDNETPEIVLLRMRSIAESFYKRKDGSYDVSKISDIVDLLRYEVLQRRAILTTDIQNTLKQAWDAAKILAKVTVHQEFGLADLWKFAIASLICNDLLKYIIDDLKSPGLLFYFTSESHLHGLLNLLLCSPISKCQVERDSVSSVDFLSHFIFKAYTDSSDGRCSRIEVYWSRGSAHSPYKLDTSSSESVLRVQEPILMSDILIPSDLQDMLDSSKDIIDLIKARDADLMPLLPTM